MNNTFEQDREFLWKKFKSPEFDPATGLDNETLKIELEKFPELYPTLPIPVMKAKAFEFLAQNVQIDVSEEDWFPSFGCWNRADRPIRPLLNKLHCKVKEKTKFNERWDDYNQSGVTSIWIDFDHSVPDWERIFKLGFSGMKSEAEKYRQQHKAKQTLTPEAIAYFDGIEITYNAVLELLKRLEELALKSANSDNRLGLVAQSLNNLQIGAPQNTYDALQFIYLYFMFSEHFDHIQARSLGNLDNLLRPFYEADLKNNIYTDSEIRNFFDYFLMQWGSIDNYWGHPFYLGRTAPDGSSQINDLSYLILEEFDKLSIPTPKIQIRIDKNTPEKFINTVLDMIRRGNSSFVFLGEQGISKALMNLGMTSEDARNCDIRGCFEFNPRGKYAQNSTGALYLNLLKPLELVFNKGVDPLTNKKLGVDGIELSELTDFNDFYHAYIKQLSPIIQGSMEIVNDFEQYLNEINPANIFSPTIENSLKTAKDAFHNGCYYNDSSVLLTGLGTLVSSLAVIKDVVYTQKAVTLEELKEILANNWQGSEKLRQSILKSKNHFGNGIKEVDEIAEMLARYLGTAINGRPNGRGGQWKAAGHSARQFIVHGEKTGATADGRFAKEELAKNISPVMGQDVKGVTALIKSTLSMDPSLFPGDFPLDVMLHPTSVAGDEGLAIWRTLLKTYFERDGIAIQFNIFDAQTLKQAQLHPEKYQGLQVRVSGWNVHFIELDKKEQEMYITRAENILR